MINAPIAITDYQWTLAPDKRSTDFMQRIRARVAEADAKTEKRRSDILAKHQAAVTRQRNKTKPANPAWFSPTPIVFSEEQRAALALDILLTATKGKRRTAAAEALAETTKPKRKRKKKQAAAEV